MLNAARSSGPLATASRCRTMPIAYSRPSATVKTRCTVVGEAINAAEGLKLFRELKPDIVTVDLLMPNNENVDATALVKTIKQERPRVAILVVSTVPFEKTMRDFLAQGVLAYIVKPFTKYSLRNTQLKLSREFPELGNLR